MNPRLAKELRPLLMPWCVVACAGLAPVLVPAAWRNDQNFLWELVQFVAPAGFFMGLPLLAAMSFGTEIQQRTLTLLLSQPVPRGRIWREKLLALAGVVATAAGVSWLGVYFLSPAAGDSTTVRSSEALVAGMFPFTTLCSATFWTLVARSTIGGTVFNLTSQFWVGFAVSYFFYRVRGKSLSPENPGDPGVILACGVVYCVLFLWLGWRKFSRLAPGALADGELSVLPGMKQLARRSLAWLCPRATGGVANLVRKELALQLPTCLVGGVLALAWLLMLALLLLGLARTRNQMDVFESVFNLLTGFQVVVALLMAGSIPLGEEKSLGLAAWHLTLPVSARRQWWIKLGVAAGVGIGFALIVPGALAWMTPTTDSVGLAYLVTHGDGEEWWWVLPLAGSFVFALTFWSATMFATTVRAVLATVLGLFAVMSCVGVGGWCAHLLGGITAALFQMIMVRFQLSPEAFGFSQTGLVMILVFGSTIGVMALMQSAAQFRRAQIERKTLVRSITKLLLMGMVIALIGRALSLATWQLESSRPVRELRSAILSTYPAPLDAPDKPVAVTLAELERMGELSPGTRSWLRNSSISIAPFLTAGGKQHGVAVTIHFPNGGSYWSVWWQPKRDAK